MTADSAVILLMIASRMRLVFTRYMNPRDELYTAIDNIYERRFDATNRFALLSLQNDFHELQTCLDEFARQGLTKLLDDPVFVTMLLNRTLSDLSEGDSLEISGEGQYYFEPTDDSEACDRDTALLKETYNLDSTMRLSGAHSGIVFMPWPAYETYRVSKNGILKMMPIVMLNNASLSIQGTDFTTSYSNLIVMLPISSRTLAVDKLIDID